MSKTKIKFVTSGSTVDVYKMDENAVSDILPPKVYIVRFHNLRGYYLEISKDKLQIPEKLYGSIEARANKCITVYKDRDKSTGILMTGHKGTGKTLLMSLLANKVIDELKLPVILIKDAFSGTDFMSFIANIGESCLVFDEFGKMYEKNHVNNDHSEPGNKSHVSQQSLLSLMDGVDKTKRLIIVTENSEWDINEFILNRPSRMYYHFRYQKLDEESIVDYCKYFNVNDDIMDDIIDISRRSRIFSFDMLQSIVEEYNRFGETVEQIIQDLNIDIREDLRIKLEIEKVTDKVTKEERTIMYNSKIVNKPSGKYDYTYVNLEPIKKDNRKNTNTVNVLDEDEESEHVRRVSFKDTNLAFEKNNKEIYETDRYTIVAKILPIINSNYSLLL